MRAAGRLSTRPSRNTWVSASIQCRFSKTSRRGCTWLSLRSRRLSASSVRWRRCAGSRACHAGSSTGTSRRARKAGRVGPRVGSSVRSRPVNFSLRHEVARLIVWHVVTRPVVPSAVSYADVRKGNDPYRACGHGTHSHPTGTRTVRGRCLCQHQAEMGLDAWYGEHMRTLDKRRDEHQAKDAARLEPKRHWSGYRVSRIPCHGHVTLPVERGHLTHACQPCGTW